MTRKSSMFSAVLLLGVMAGFGASPAGDGQVESGPVILARSGSDGGAGAGRGALPPYEIVNGLSGRITSVGDSTTTNLVARAAAEFRRVQPEVRLQATAGLAPVGLAALLEGWADIVPMSRALTPGEISDFHKKYGYPPTQIKVAADALAIYVEKTNPVASMTLTQLDGVFSRTQLRGGGSIETWGQLGLTEEWVDRPIRLYGYDPADGVNQTFRRQVLGGGEFRLSLRIERTGSAIVQDVAADPQAIGCASIFFAAKRVRAVPLAGSDGKFYAPTSANIRAHKYPLSRYLYVCVNKPPNRSLSGPAAEFTRFLLSREGQQIVGDGGNIPLNAVTAEQGRRALE